MENKEIKKILCFLFFACILWACPSFAANEAIVVVKQSGVKVYDRVLDGFESTTRARVRVVETGGFGSEGRIIEAVHDSAAPIVFAIGEDSLARVADIKKRGLLASRILFAMALDPAEVLSPPCQATGVEMAIDPSVALDTLKKVLPQAKRLGVVYDPSKTGYVYSALVKAAKQRGMAVKGIAVSRPGQVPPALDSLAGKIDAIYMLPDVTVLDPINIEYMTEISLEKRIPVFAISEKYVENGALLALGLDPFDIGRQAGEMVNRFLPCKKAICRADFARKGVLSINLRVAKILGIRIPDDVRKAAAEVVK